DRARLTAGGASGELEHLGRLDDQIKVRGFRIEPGEIEAALAIQPVVRESAVVMCEERGEKRLVAYVVLQGDESGSSRDGSLGEQPQEAFARRTAPRLRRALRERLPEHMVPSAFVVLDALPLTANGKVDRRALARRDLALEQARTPEGYAPPRGVIEETLCSLWSEVLGVDRIGRDAIFFDLGGHSLLATQVISRVRSAFRVELPLQVLFERPTVAGLAEAVEEALREAGCVAPPPLRRTPREALIPLSFAQERLWFLHHLLPDDPSYNELVAVRLQGMLKPDALEWSARRIALRHEALRTTFPAVDGQGVQMVSPSPGFSWLRVDLRGLPAGRREAEAQWVSRKLADLPFNLERGPLLRPALVQLGEEESTLLMMAHHIVLDGWSGAILQRELAVFYRAFVERREPRLPLLPVQYADFAAWQRSWLQGEALDRLLGYWRARLVNLPPLELPTDRPRPEVASSQGARLVRTLPASVAADLAAFALERSATPFMVLLAAFSAVLSRLTGQTDLAIGSPIAGRNRSEIEGLIGFFVNSLVLRVDASGAPGLRELADRVREVATGAYSHEDLPFEILVRELQPRRELGRNPLFQVVFQLHDPPGGETRMPGLSVRPLATGETRAKFDLHLSAVDTADGMRMVADYRQDLFDGTTVLRLLEHIQTLLTGALAAPDRPFPDLPLLSATERQQAAVEWNDSTVDYPRGRTVHALFAEQARRTPQRVALLHGDERLSYGELEARSNRLARHLRALGVGLEVPVGLVLPRSIDMIVALLGILKAGGAYVPLDPVWPRDRLAELIDRIGAPVVIARDTLAGELERSGLTLVRPDGAFDAGAIAARSSAPLVEAALPESLAYVLFTSGSTGVPNAVGVPHRAVVRLVRGTGFVAWGPHEVFLQLAPLAFDASTLEIWGSLLHGARLALMPHEASSLEDLARALERYGVTTLWLTAGLFHAMVDEQLAGLRRLRHLLAGGDVLSPSHVRRALQRLEGCSVVNGYGPTENTTFTCCHVMTGDLPGSGPVPVGRPVASTRALILDDNLRPVPIGAPAQLYAAGDGLARGYLNRPDLTAAHFVPHPFGEPGERLYATGDRVRLLADGRVEFLGRNDRQLKLRGFRVELGEVEALVAAHPDVRDVVAGVREDTPGDRRLIIWYVPEEGGAAPGELREFLKRKAPAWLMPSAFVHLDHLPLTANGKVDRRALPVPDAGRVETGFVAPRNAREERLAALLGEVLGVERVGVHDDFFELGGYSLLATKVVSRIRDEFQVELPLRALFEAPSVAELAQRLEEPGNAVLPEEAPIQRLERGADDLEQLLSQLQGLGDEEVRALLEAGGAPDLSLLP
ncbi:MAG TPA: amino acid adenylation domain-containing protein, partial [Thermoanaerobaculia bacterium]|nr:amino acid adenylation domain-containing protein [Thermoanaerobaculia bacterium]